MMLLCGQIDRLMELGNGLRVCVPRMNVSKLLTFRNGSEGIAITLFEVQRDVYRC